MPRGDNQRGGRRQQRVTASGERAPTTKQNECATKQIVRRRKMMMLVAMSASSCVAVTKLKAQQCVRVQRVQQSYCLGLSWSRRPGCCRRSAWRSPAVWGGSAGGCWGDWLCKVEPRNQTQRRPDWSACGRQADTEVSDQVLLMMSVFTQPTLQWQDNVSIPVF